MAAVVIALIQSIVMRFLCLKFFGDKSHKPVLIAGDIHHVEVFSQKLPGFFHLCRIHNLTDGDNGSADLIPFAQHVRQTRVIWLDSRTAVFDGHALLENEQRHDRCNVDLAPAVGRALIAALDIGHGSRQLFAVLHDQVFFDCRGSVPVRFKAGHGGICAGEDFRDLRVRLYIL